jgi:hypothetical protein
LIAADLEAEGAEHAALVELWAGSVVLVRSNLICIPTDGPLGWMIDRIRGANGGRLGGLPDVIATFSDGRVAFREAKSVSGKDRLRANQHAMADVLRGEFGRWAELAIVEWDL